MLVVNISAYYIDWAFLRKSLGLVYLILWVVTGGRLVWIGVVARTAKYGRLNEIFVGVGWSWLVIWCGPIRICHGVVRLSGVVNSATQTSTTPNLQQPGLYRANEVLSNLPYFAIWVVAATQRSLKINVISACVTWKEWTQISNYSPHIFLW